MSSRQKWTRRGPRRPIRQIARASARAPAVAEPQATTPGRNTRLLQVRGAAAVVAVGVVERRQQAPVAEQQGPLVHGRVEVGAGEGVAQGRQVVAEAALLLEAPPQPGAGDGGQHAHHGARDGEAGDELELPVEDLGAVAVEPHDEPGEDLEPGAGELLDGALLRHAQVLALAGLARASLDGVSIPMNTAEKPAATMPATSGGWVARSTLASVQKSKGKPCRSCHARQHREQARHLAPVADEVVVHEEERAAGPAARGRASSSATTCSGLFTRGTRPNSSTMSQNSQWNGQPREYCSGRLA